MWPKPNWQRGATLAICTFVAAAAMTCGAAHAATNEGAGISAENDLVPDPPRMYFVGAGHMPHGKGVAFFRYDLLAEDYRRAIDGMKLNEYPSMSGRLLYESESFDSKLRVAVDNFMTKSAATMVHSQEDLERKSSVLSHITKIHCIHQDRFFGTADDTLLALVSASSEVFKPLGRMDNNLHPAADGYRIVGNFKTRDKQGNLQIVFSTNGADTRVEVDIDKAQGFFAHNVGEVGWNHVMHRLTNPYAVAKILATVQHLALPYVIIDAARAEKSAPVLAAALTY